MLQENSQRNQNFPFLPLSKRKRCTEKIKSFGLQVSEGHMFTKLLRMEGGIGISQS